MTQNNFTDALKTKLDSLSNYTLVAASDSTLGGIKVGTNLSIDGNGVLSATDTNTTYSVGDGGLTQNNFTDTLKTKLDGIATSANNYSLPNASASSLGGIKVGTNLSIDVNGVLSATDTNTTYSVGDGGLTQNNFTDALKTKLDSLSNYTLPTATDSILGGIKVGTNLSIDANGVLSATDTNTTYSVGDGGLTQNNFTDALKTKLDSLSNYTLPTATDSILGGIKVGTNLSIDVNGVLSATDTNTTYSVGDGGLTQNNFTDALKTKLDGIATSANNYSLPTSSTSTLGGVKVDGSTITISDGVISSSGGGGSYTLPTASSSTLGGIKVGTGLSIDSSTGVLSAGTVSSSTLDGQVLETLAGLCDGRTVTVSSGTYTLPEVTASTLLSSTSTWVDIPGSIIDYKPPPGTKQVVYMFNFQYAAKDTESGAIFTVRFTIDDVEVTTSYIQFEEVRGDNGNFKIIIDIGNVSSDDIANAKLASWNLTKKLEVSMCLYHTSYETYINSMRYGNVNDSLGHSGTTPSGTSSTNANLRIPRLEIQAIGQSSPQSAILPTASTTTLGGIKVGTGLTIDNSTSVLSTNITSAWTTSGSDIYRSSGNVGIGTTSFVDSRNTGGLHITNEKGISFKANTGQTDSRNWRIKPDDLGPWGSLGFCVSDSNSTTPGASADHGDVAMILTRDKKVGIGTTSPETLLTIGNHPFSNGTRDLLRFPSKRHTEAFTIRNNDDDSTGRLEFYYGNSQNGSGGHDSTVDATILTLIHNGNVGIGTTSPGSFKLNVNSSTNGHTGIKCEGPGSGTGASGWNGFSAFGSSRGYWVCGENGGTILVGGHNGAFNAWQALRMNDLGNITVNNGGGIFYYRTLSQLSDDRLKHNEESVTNALDVINQLRPKTYFKSGGLTEDRGQKLYVENHNYELDDDGNPITEDPYVKETGFIAQEVNQIPELSHLVTEGTEDTAYSLDYTGLFVYNIQATQELDRIQQQELTKVKDLEIENFLLKERVKDLESKMNDVLNRLAQLENN